MSLSHPLSREGEVGCKSGQLKTRKEGFAAPPQNTPLGFPRGFFMPLSEFDRRFVFKIKDPVRWDVLTALPIWFDWLLQELLKLFPFDLEGFAHLFKILHTRTTKQIHHGFAETLEEKDLLQLHTLESFGSILYINTGLLREKSHRKKLKDEGIYRTILKTRNPLRSLRGQFQLGLF